MLGIEFLEQNNINITNNQFNCNDDQYCLSIIGMKNVNVINNTFTNCNKVARIYLKDYSYDLQGNKVDPGENDGFSTNIIFDSNKGNGYIVYKTKKFKKKIKISSTLDISS